MYNNYLQHYGIPGMKWGVRRAQKQAAKTNSMSKDAKEVSDIRKKKIHEMSNEDLRKVNSRQELERKYKQMNPTIVKKGYQYVAAASGAMGLAIAAVNSSKQIRDLGAKVIKKLTNK